MLMALFKACECKAWSLSGQPWENGFYCKVNQSSHQETFKGGNQNGKCCTTHYTVHTIFFAFPERMEHHSQNSWQQDWRKIVIIISILMLIKPK